MFVPRSNIQKLIPFLGKKMVFIHTPKCGGSLVNTVFSPHIELCPTLRWKEAAGHKTYLEYFEIFRKRNKNLNDFFLFTVIRNPWDWHLSWYNYVKKDIDGIKSGMLTEHLQIRDLSFTDYLEWLNDSSQERSENDYMRRQISDWIVDQNENIVVDHILRQESLEKDLLSFQELLGLKVTIPLGQRINASRISGHYQKEYTNRGVEIVEKRHRRDIELFGYSFE